MMESGNPISGIGFLLGKSFECINIVMNFYNHITSMALCALFQMQIEPPISLILMEN